jgi:aspartyl aminopeptidase
MAETLQLAGFSELNEGHVWHIASGGQYFLRRNNSSIIAFTYGKKPLVSSGLRMIGAHTDSPNLKVKPQPDLYQQGFWQLAVETYGGVLLNPWFDRPLALAGRVAYEAPNGQIEHVLVDSKSAVGCIPSLAIHLDREANKSRSINPQTDVPVVMALDEGRELSFDQFLHEQITLQYPDIQVSKILDHEMSFYEAERGSIFGLKQEFISASRLDNLLSCFVGLEALLSVESEESLLLVCNDHEEVGSQSAVGADGAMLEQFLKRLSGDEQSYARMMNASMMISADNAHAVHPNFANKHDKNHGPQLNAGPVIKINANQRYASNALTQAIFRQCCEKAGVPVQSFVVRSDMACGSTIGPMTSANLGVKTVDVGVPTFAMHSIREMAGIADTDHMIAALAGFYQRESVTD